MNVMRERYSEMKQLNIKQRLLKNVNKHRKWNEFVRLSNYQQVKNLVIEDVKHQNNKSGNVLTNSKRKLINDNYQPSSEINIHIMKQLIYYDKTLNVQNKQQHELNNNNTQ